MRRIAETLQDQLNWQTKASDLPLKDEPTGQADATSAHLLFALETEERQGAESLRSLAHGEVGSECSLVAPLLEAMAMDSDKDAYLLKFLAEHLARAGGRAT